MSRFAAAALCLALLACGGKRKPTPPAPAAALTPAQVTLQVLNATSVSPLGTKLTLFATVSDGATGTVDFLDDADLLGSAPVGGTSQSWGASLDVWLESGPHALTAKYLGDKQFTNATTLVAQPETIVPIAAPTSFVLTISPNPAPVGQAVTLTATLDFSGIAAVLLTDIGTVTFTTGTTTLTSAATLASGVATYTVSSLPAGTYDVTATYTPFLAAVSPVVSAPVSLVITPS